MKGLKDVQVRKLKGKPYKLVLLEWDCIGLFDHGKYVDKKSFNNDQHLAAAKFHAETMKERLEDIK
jgi:hypothetical protein